MSSAVANLKIERKRHEIEARYGDAINTFLQQYDINARLLKAELQMKCHVLKTLRDAELRELERGNENVKPRCD